jgi:hypothetical protein
MAINKRIDLDSWTPQDPTNPLKSLAHEIGEQLDALEKKIPTSASALRFASGYVNAGTFVTLDNIRATVTTTGNRGLSVASVTGTFQAHISGTFGYVSGVGGSATTGPVTYNTTPSGSYFGWSFPNQGDGSTYLINDVTNMRFYRVTLMIGPGYSNNFISIERLG